MTWALADAIADVRAVLSDGPTDKLRWQKQVIGVVNGTTKIFKTFEARRVSAFVSANGNPIGVFVDGVLATVDSEDLESGSFTIHTAPTNGQTITANYYCQWFTDDEITRFLVSAAEWIGVADSYTAISEDLRPAAKEYAAYQAYQKLVAKFSANLSETYQLYDVPDQKRFDPIQAYMKIAESKLKMAFELRDDVYKDRKGQALAPKFATLRGRVRDVPPKT